jgi:hypothetical protein
VATSDIDPCRGTNQLENEKFALNENGDVVIRVRDEFASSGSGSDVSNPLAGLNWDAFLITDNTLTDVVQYYEGGLAGTLLATFTATYTSARKKTVVSGVWTYP